MKSITVYGNDKIIKNEDGSYEWISNTGESEHFEGASDLLNYAEEYEPQAYADIAAWLDS